MKGMRGLVDLLRFNGMRVPSSDFHSVASDLQIPYLFYELDLTNARSIAAGTAAQLPIKGNSLYIDQAPDVGNAYAWMNEQIDSVRKGRVYLQPGFNCDIPFDLLTIENDAQPGKVLRLLYGVDIDFKPGIGGTLNVAVTNLSDEIVSTQEVRYQPGVIAQSATALAAATASVVFSVGANVNGAILHFAQAFTYSGAGNRLALLSHTSTPASIATGTAHYVTQNYPSSVTANVIRNWPLTIPAGRGLWWFGDNAETAATTYRIVEYTLL